MTDTRTRLKVLKDGALRILKRTWKPIRMLFTLATILTIVAFWFALLLPEDVFYLALPCSKHDNIAVIRIRGDIVEDEGMYARVSTPAELVMKQIEQVKAMPNIGALFFDINSDGGNAVAGDEIATAIHSVTGKAKVSVIRGSGLSASYLIASAADRIYADAFSSVGNIGITLSYVDQSGKYAQEGLVYQAISSGTYKDATAPGHRLTTDERAMMQRNVDDSARMLTAKIAKYRGKTAEDVAKLADGTIYNGTQSQKLGLVDEIGGLSDVVSTLEKTWGVRANVCEIDGFIAPKTLSGDTGVR